MQVEEWTRELHGWAAPMFNLHGQGTSSATVPVTAARPGEGGVVAWDVPGQIYRYRGQHLISVLSMADLFAC